MAFDAQYTSLQYVQPIQLTVLQSLRGRRLTKYFARNETKRYDNAKWFIPFSKTVAGFSELSAFLTKLEKQKDRMVVLGTIAEHCKTSQRIRRLGKDHGDDKATLIDEGSRIVHFDVDDLPVPDGSGWHDTEKLATATWAVLCDRIPAISNVSVHWQASSSAGLRGKEHLSKFHFWMLLDKPIDASARKKLFAMAGSDLKLASFSQPNYTATPIFDGVPDPLAGQVRSGVIRGARDHALVADIIFPEADTISNRTSPKQKGTNAAGPHLSKQVAWKPTGHHALDQACKAILSAEHRNVEINRQAYWIGGLVAGGQIEEHEARSALLDAGRRCGHERYEEAVLNGFRDGFAKPIFPKTPVVAAPYFSKSEIPREEAIHMHSEAIRRWGRQAIETMQATAEVRRQLNKLDSSVKANAAERRRVREAVQAEFGLDWLPSSSISGVAVPRVMLTGAQGVGKTSALVGRDGRPGVLHDTKGLMSIMFMPTHQKSAEAAADYQKNATPGAPAAVTLFGRGADDPDLNGATKMCPAYDLANAVVRVGLSVRQNLCPICPFRDSCGYLRQEGDLEKLSKSGQGAVLFAAHEYAFLPLPGNIEPDLTVFDERPRDFGVEEVTVPIADLQQVPQFKRSLRAKSKTGQAAEQADALSLLKRVIEPVVTALARAAKVSPDSILAALRADGITSVMLEEAAGGLRGFVDRSLPEEVETDFKKPAPNIKAIAARIEERGTKSYARLAALLETLAWELRTEHTTATAVFVEEVASEGASGGKHSAFCVSRVRHLRCGERKPFLHLDGTGDIDIARVIFGADLAHDHYPVERNAIVTQVRGCNFSKRYICGLRNNGSPVDGNIGQKSSKLRSLLSDWISDNPKAAIFANKSVIKSLALEGEERAGHFGALRGMNRWQACESIMVIGREQPSAQSIEQIARAFASAAGDVVEIGDYLIEQRGIRMLTGSASLEVQRHPDRWGDRVLRQIREAEIAQAIDRVRLIHNAEPKHVYLLSPVVVDITVDEIVEWSDFKAGGARLDRAMLSNAVIPLSGSECARLMPGLWANRETASADLRNSGLKSGKVYRPPLYIGSDRNRICRVSYRPHVPRPGRARQHEALVFSKPDEARRHLEALAGTLSKFSILEIGPVPNVG